MNFCTSTEFWFRFTKFCFGQVTAESHIYDLSCSKFSQFILNILHNVRRLTKEMMNKLRTIIPTENNSWQTPKPRGKIQLLKFSRSVIIIWNSFLMICDSTSAYGFPAVKRSNITFHTLRSYPKGPGKRFFTCGIVYAA